MIGNWSSLGVSVLDLDASTLDVITVDSPTVAARVSGTGQLYILNQSGAIVALNPATGTVTAAAQTMDSFEIDPWNGTVRPGMTLVGTWPWWSLTLLRERCWTRTPWSTRPRVWWPPLLAAWTWMTKTTTTTIMTKVTTTTTTRTTTTNT